MSKKHGKSDRHSAKHGHSHPNSRKGFHKDWRTWVVVLLMLTGIAVYVATFDESLRPVEAPQEGVPTATDTE